MRSVNVSYLWVQGRDKGCPEHLNPVNQTWFRNCPEALLAVSERTLRITGCSDRVLHTLGFGCDQLRSRTLHDLFTPPVLDQIITAAERGDLGELLNCQIRDRNGSPQDCDLCVSRVPEQETILIAIHDASPRNKLVEELRQAKKMEALGMLAGGIAHDFNNLLTIIAGYTQMLMASPRVTAERDRSSLEQVLKASERAAELTTQLLAFSRRQSLQPRVIELNRAVDQTATMLRRLIGENIELRISKAPDAGRVYADAGQLQQLMLNLVINARDAMPNGGSLLIRSSRTQLGEDYVGQHLGVKPGKYAVLEVSDKGSGMDESTRNRIFEPFFTTKPQGRGTGLGLSTVYGIVRQLGGSIDLYTELGHGTTFCVYLPAVEDAAVDEAAQQDDARGGHETVLLVEDEEGVRKMVHAALERKGYHVLVASAAPEALRIAEQWDGPLDLVVTDVIMPLMNGGEMAQELSRIRPNAAVLFISGYAGNTLLNAGTIESGSAFLQKPFTPASLTERVRTLLDSRRMAYDTATG